LIPNQEIKHGIYIASNTATSKNAFIRLLNTTNRDQVVSTNNLAYESLSNCDVVKTNLENREKSVLSQLSKNFPPQFKSQLSSLCTQYNDIFGLETEPISTNNFNKQKLRLKDDEPVYIKREVSEGCLPNAPHKLHARPTKGSAVHQQFAPEGWILADPTDTDWQIPGNGLFQCRVMPFGLQSASATFQRVLDQLIGPEMSPHAFA